MKQRAVFIDKDGTLIENVPYNADPQKIEMSSGAEDALRRLHEQGYLLVIVTNQPGVALGYFSEAALEEVYQEIERRLAAWNVPLSGFAACVHHPQAIIEEYRGACTCRKPSPGLLFQAADGLMIDLENSWMVGDILNDIEAGSRAGSRTILVDRGNETEWVLTPLRTPDYVVSNLSEAADVILEAV
jgi:D-glycero-D-manno-heptose 1,7-bisphosphate phosphatase